MPPVVLIAKVSAPAAPTMLRAVTVVRFPGPDAWLPVKKPRLWAPAFAVMLWPAPALNVKAVAVPVIAALALLSRVKVSVVPTRFNVAGARRSSRTSTPGRQEPKQRVAG